MILAPGGDGLFQFRQRLGQRDRQPGRLPGHEAHRPPVMRGHVGVRAAPFRLAALVVPALRDWFRAGVGDEMVIDVIHPGGHRVGGQHRPGGQSPAAPADRPHPRSRPAPGRRVRRCGSTASPASGPAHAAVRCLTCSVVSAPSAKHMLVTDSSATSREPPGRPAARPRRGLQHLPRPGMGRERVQQHRPGIPRPEHPAGDQRPARPRRRRTAAGPSRPGSGRPFPAPPRPPGSPAPRLPFSFGSLLLLW